MTVQQSDDQSDEEVENNDSTGQEECYQPHPTRQAATIEGNLCVPGDIFPSLFSYQKTGVRWLWELYSQQVGGIIGDEMGLGKTIQVIAFLAGLHYSHKLTKPVIVVAPATVMKQWVNEFHRWWPPLRVSILHSSGSGMMDVSRESQMEHELESSRYHIGGGKMTKAQKAAKKIVNRVVEHGHVLVTTYSGLQSYAEHLIPVEWEYAVLDEGHKIRNPNAGITIYCKELRTSNRIILSGTPMQNNLTELWSLFDFVFPMRLGNLVTFRQQFEVPIKQGGYANASNLQVETAMKCAETLKDTISPYLLQRFKVDVAADLPRKSERVLFCKLTRPQREAYETFLNSGEMKAISAGKRQALYGVDLLRKICNHPDLAEHKILSKQSSYKYGSGAKSGKMQVVKALLELWKRGGHKTLLFAQHRIMLDILERFVRGMPGFRYRRMDGNTSIRDRQDMVDDFNRDPALHVFLLTTKVGGLGVNLTGADRVIIYDPDWNPSTDVQARERAWRLGQKREVEIYRLMTAGTIEEKIYHRQIFKQFLTNKILRDPKQRQTFQLRDLHDLFSLGEVDGKGETETGTMFKGTEVRFERGNDKSSGNGERREGDETGHEKLPQIMGIAHEEDYNTGVTDITNPDNKTTTTTPSASSINPANTPTTLATAQPPKPDPLLNTIFSRSNVHSALEHDAILASNSNSNSSSNSNNNTRTLQRKKVTADPAIIAAEARRVASEAAKGLKRAADVAKSIPAGTPTWTGMFGVGGKDVGGMSNGHGGVGYSRGGGIGRGRGGGRSAPSSATILSNLAVRQNRFVPTPLNSVTNTTTTTINNINNNSAHHPSTSLSPSPNPPTPSARTSSPPHSSLPLPLNSDQPSSSLISIANTNDTTTANTPTPEVLLTQIITFLRAHNNAAHTQMLVDRFSHACGRSAARTAQFRELLRRVAVLDMGGSSSSAASAAAGGRGGRGGGGVGVGMGRGGGGVQAAGSGRSGRGKWILREEFR